MSAAPRQFRPPFHSSRSLRPAVVTLLIACLLVSANAIAGPIIIGGDDMTQHGSYQNGANQTGWLYIEKAIGRMLEQGCITRPNDGSIAALGCTPSTITAGDAGAAIDYVALALGGVPVNHYDGAAAIDAFFASLAAGNTQPAIIWMPTYLETLPNDLNAAEVQAIANHAAELANFVNSGGGLMAHTIGSYPGGNPWLQALIPGLIESPNPQCLFTGSTLTAEGNAAFPGLTNADITVDQCHTTFSGNLGTLQVLALDGNGRNLILGGSCSSVLNDGCTPPPPGMVAWFPFDAANPALELVTGWTATTIGHVGSIPGKVIDGMEFLTVASSIDPIGYLSLPGWTGLDFGTGDFSVDAWVKGWGRVVSKIGGTGGGFEVGIRCDRILLQLSDAGGTTEYESDPFDFLFGDWVHITVTVQRTTNQGVKMYVNGNPVNSFTPTTPIVSLTNSAPLRVGTASPCVMGPAAVSKRNELNFLRKNFLDEVEIFNRALSPTEVQGIAYEGSGGKCREYCLVPCDLAFCPNDPSISTSVTVCNYTGQAADYSITFLPVNAGWSIECGTCTVAGPPFILSGYPLPVSSGTCGVQPFTIPRPTTGFGAQGARSCYEVMITNLTTGKELRCHGSVHSEPQWCPDDADDDTTNIRIGNTSPIQVHLTNLSVMNGTLRWRARLHGENPDTMAIGFSLNGQSPGASLSGTIGAGIGSVATLLFNATATRHEAFHGTELLIEADTAGNGSYRVVTTRMLRTLAPIQPPPDPLMPMADPVGITLLGAAMAVVAARAAGGRRATDRGALGPFS